MIANVPFQILWSPVNFVQIWYPHVEKPLLKYQNLQKKLAEAKNKTQATEKKHFPKFVHQIMVGNFNP